jgi:antitoxin MazE
VDGLCWGRVNAPAAPDARGTCLRGGLALAAQGRYVRLQRPPSCDYIVITMKARLVRIGNSRGLRLPKAVIDQVGLGEDIELRVENDRLIITAARPPRTGWADAARRLAAESRGLLDAPSPTRFDEDEWRW